MARVVFHNKGFRELRSDPGVVADLERRAEAIADWCNSNGKGRYATSSQQGKRKPQGRWRTTVITADADSMRDNAKHQRLLEGLDAGS